MDSLQDLYREVILDHTKRPRNYGELPEATHEAEGHNPLCGDCVTIQLVVREGVVERVAFKGTGCAISTASASMLTDAVKGKPVDEVEDMFRQFRDALTKSDHDVDEERLGEFCALLGVKEFPMRVKCATLAWHTLTAALADSDAPVSTEQPTHA